MKKGLILCLICSLLFSGITVTPAYANASAENQLEQLSKDMVIPLSDAEMAKIRQKVKQLEKLDDKVEKESAKEGDSTVDTDPSENIDFQENEL